MYVNTDDIYIISICKRFKITNKCFKMTNKRFKMTNTRFKMTNKRFKMTNRVTSSNMHKESKLVFKVEHLPWWL
jgi:hypothetical protein